MHRDLKPENVLLSAGHAVVADFGIAKALAAATQGGSTAGAGLTSAGVALGTPAYMAPEQAVGDIATDHRADLYALGVVAYEVLAGVHPFGARSPQALVAAHLTEPPAPLGARRSDVPPALIALVMRLLAKDPAARPQSAAAVVRALDGAPPVSTPRVSVHRRVLLAGAGAVLVVASVGGYAVWRKTAASDDRRDVAATSEATGGARGPPAIRTVAVLPFVNTSGTPADDYFSDGLTDELIAALGKVAGLTVTGRTSAFALKATRLSMRAIADTLRVAAIVTGSVRRAGSRLRVTAFRRAIAHDPAFARAYAGLANAHLLMVVFANGRPSEELPLAQAAAARALELDSTLAEAHVALGHILVTFE